MLAKLLMQVWPVILIAFVVLVLAFWIWDEREDEEEWAETTKKVGDRSQRAVGGVMGVLVATAFAIGGMMAEAGMQLNDLVMAIMDLINGNPEMASGLAVAVLGWLGLRGTIYISPFTYGGIAIVVLGLGLILAARKAGGSAGQ